MANKQIKDLPDGTASIAGTHKIPMQTVGNQTVYGTVQTILDLVSVSATPLNPWEFDTGTADADPGTGKFRLNNATLSSVTQVYVSKTNSAGVQEENLLEKLRSSDNLYIQQKDDQTKAVLFEVNADAADAGAYIKISVTYQDGGTGGLMTAATNCSFILFASSSQQETVSLPAKRSLMSLSANQTAGLTAGSPVRFDGYVGDYDYDTATYELTIPAGEKVELIGAVGMNFTGASASAIFQWYDVTGAAYVGEEAVQFPVTNTGNNVSQPTAIAHVLPTVETKYQLMIKTVTGTISSIFADSTFARAVYQGQGALTPVMAPVRCTKDDTTSVSTGTDTVVDFDNVVKDDDGTVTTGDSAWAFTAPHDGYFKIACLFTWAVSSDWDINERSLTKVQKYDGSWADITPFATMQYQSMPSSPANWIRSETSVPVTVYLAAGEKLRVAVNQTSNATQTIAAAGFIEVEEVPTRLSTLSQPIYKAHAKTNTARVLTANVTDVIFEDQVYDPNGMIDLTNGRITPPVKCWVVVHGCLNGNSARTALVYNATTPAGVGAYQGSSGQPGEVNYSGVVDPGAGEYLTIRSTASMTLNGNDFENRVMVECYPI